MGELWKDVYGYDFYEVSSEGRIRSKGRFVNSNKGSVAWKKGRILKPQKRKHGYLGVWLYTGESKKQVSVHRLVAEAFCERKDGQTEVNHLNENKQDNRAINLAWCTKSENCSYGSRPSTISRKNTNGKKSKAVRQFTVSGEFVAEYPSLHEVERQTGMSYKNIYHAVNGKMLTAYGYVWKYVTEIGG